MTHNFAAFNDASLNLRKC